MTKDLRHRMGRAHEEFLAELFGGLRTQGSGNQWRNPMDGRVSRTSSEFAFAWDGKSTLNHTIAVSRTMWRKAQEQSLGERPMLGLRFYDTEGLDVGFDLAVVNAYDLSELIERANGDSDQA